MSAAPTKPKPEASLADYGYIAYLVERLFLGIESAAVLQRLFGLKPRRRHHQDLVQAGPEESRDVLVRRNARRADSYVLTFVGIEALLLVWAGIAPQSFQAEFSRIVIITICWYRLVDIVQNIVNRLIFAPLRGFGQDRMASSVRTLILTMVAYFEVTGCFALLYFVWQDGSQHCSPITD